MLSVNYCLLTNEACLYVLHFLLCLKYLRNICNYVYVTGYAKFDQLSANKSLIFLVLALS